ncbi:MAG: hydroxyacid dehydrogenase [Rhodobacteraceae bacterium]|nr:hydroxyacid dehydrogenase [Paracoccaceae bacterium]
MTTQILVTGPDLDPSAAALLAEHGYEAVHTPPYADSAVISDYLKSTGAVGIISRMGRLDEAVMEVAPQLRVISKHGVGVDNIDLEAAAKRGIPVLVATGANAVSVAEHAIALLLATVKRILPLDSGLRDGRWEKPGFSGSEIAGRTLALMGMGSIARATGRIAKGLGMELIGYDPFADESAFAELGVRRFSSFGEMLEHSHVLSLHCPLNDQTRKILNADTIARMPKGSYVVNTARGGLIDEDALVAAIQSGHLAGAGLDTFAIEPPQEDHPFFSVPEIVLTPHIGGVTREAGARVGVDAVRGIFQILAGQPVPQERIANWKLLEAAVPPLAKVED